MHHVPTITAVFHVNATQDTKVMVSHVSTSTNAPPEPMIVISTPLVQTSVVPSHVAVMLVMPETVKPALISMSVLPMVTTVMSMRLVPTLLAVSLAVVITDIPEMVLFAVM